MKTSKERRRERRRREQQKLTTQSAAPLQNSMSIRRTLAKRIEEHPLVVLMGVAASAMALIQVCYDAWHEPDVSLVESDSLAPAPGLFAIKNVSILFTMMKAQVFCHVGTINLARSNSHAQINGGLFTNGAKMDIGTNEIVNYPCPMFGARPADVQSGHIGVQVRYKTLWFIPRCSEVYFSWYSAGNPPQWIRGPFGTTNE